MIDKTASAELLPPSDVGVLMSLLGALNLFDD